MLIKLALIQVLGFIIAATCGLSAIILGMAGLCFHLDPKPYLPLFFSLFLATVLSGAVAIAAMMIGDCVAESRRKRPAETQD